MDLRELARLTSTRSEVTGAVLAPYAADSSALAEAIAALRARGEVVVELLPGEKCSDGPSCDRQLVEHDGQWVIKAINRDG